MVIVGMPLVTIDSHDKVILHEETLKRIVTNDRIKDLPVVVVSVCGPPESGKSLLLDFFFRYIRYRYSDKEDKEDTSESTVKSIASWIAMEDQPLQRAIWSSGVADGIMIWPDVFVCQERNEGSVALLFMETHGTFEETDDSWKWVNMLVLSTLMSSVQIYNVGTELKKEHVKLLDVLLDYGKEVKATTRRHALMKFHYLVRDWSAKKPNKIGSWGGYKILEQFTKNRGNNEEPIYKRMKSSFLEVGCYLMPYPGGPAGQEGELINLGGFDELFLDCMSTFVQMLVGPNKIATKEVSGQQLKTRHLEAYLRSYISEALSNPQVVSTSDIFAASSKASHEVAKEEAVRIYLVQTLWYCSEECTVDQAELNGVHEQSRAMAMEAFTTASKIGGDAFTDSYRGEVEEELQNMYTACKNRNWRRRLKHYLINRMTITLLIIVLIFIAISAVMSFMDRRADMKRALFTTQLFVVLLLSWLFFQYRKVQ